MDQTLDQLSDIQECDGELNGGNYTWTKENPDENYVFFLLNGRANISQIHLTYAAISSVTQSPKVSFCAVLGDNIYNTSQSNLNCRKMDIQATTSYMIQTSSLEMPFDQDTVSVTMEVVTQGIKANFIASEVQFFGEYTTNGTGI